MAARPGEGTTRWRRAWQEALSWLPSGPFHLGLGDRAVGFSKTDGWVQPRTLLARRRCLHASARPGAQLMAQRPKRSQTNCQSLPPSQGNCKASDGSCVGLASTRRAAPRGPRAPSDVLDADRCRRGAASDARRCSRAAAARLAARGPFRHRGAADLVGGGGRADRRARS